MSTLHGRRHSLRSSHRRTGALRASVLLVDEDTPSRTGLEFLLRQQPWVARCATADDRGQAADVARELRPEVAVVSIDPFIATTVQAIRDAHGPTRVILLAHCAGSGAVFKRRLRTAGFVPPSATASEIVETVRRVTVGSTGEPRSRPPVEVPLIREELSPREMQILTLMSTGATNREIAEELHLGPDSIKKYATAIYRKLGVRNRTEASQQILSGAAL